MNKIKKKLYDWKDRLKDRHMLTLVISMLTIIVILGLYTYKKQRDYRQVSENQYNLAFYELLNYVQNVEVYLSKSLVTKTPEHATETLTYVWREANLAQSYLSRLPINSSELENTSKFLNQVSDYSYSLSRKNIYGEELNSKDLEDLKNLHEYSNDLYNTLNQLALEINQGRISWGELTKKGKNAFSKQTSNISKESFNNIEGNFHEYAGLIYDGAFSEHMTNPERKGLNGEEINEENAMEIAKKFIGSQKIKEIKLNSVTENANIPSYDFSVVNINDENIWISISKKGGHIIFMNHNRNVNVESIQQENINEIGKKFLEEKGYKNMESTYQIKQEGIVTINYAYSQYFEKEKVTIYPDLIKLKIALDNGEVLGIETTGYLNSHEEREFNKIKVSKNDARKKINENLEILSESLAIIPTEYHTEKLCWEFKGKVEEREFLVYINVDSGKEEDTLIILKTPNGTLTI